MLNLIYYDLKATIKKLWAYFLLVAIFSFVVRFLWSSAFKGMFNNDTFYIGTVIMIAALGFLAALGILVLIVAIVIQAQWYDENILSPEGQLTNMLPVSSFEIVISKIIVALFWSLVIMAIATGVMAVFMVNTDMFKELVTSVAEISTQNNIHISFMSVVASFGFCMSTAITSVLALCFFAQTFGQMFNSFRNMMILVAFVAVFALTIFVEYKFCVSSGLLDIEMMTTSRDVTAIVGLVIRIVKTCSVMNLISTIVYWLVTSSILRTHLNLI